MKNTLIAVALAAACAGLAGAARAQIGTGAVPMSGGTVVCESRNGQYQECAMPFRGPAVVVNVLSSSACDQGRTWGSRGFGVVWVSNGCRAEFGPGYAPPPNPGIGGGAVPMGAIRCESENGNYRACPTPAGVHMVLTSQLSTTMCVEGRTWGNSYDSVWVRGGCRGEFQPAGGWTPPQPIGPTGRTIECSSNNLRHQACYWNPGWGYPRLSEQLSEDDCREGRSWGYDGRSQIWVDRGCRARFTSGY